MSKGCLLVIIIASVINLLLGYGLHMYSEPSQEVTFNHWEQLQKKKTMPNEVFEKPDTWLSQSDQSAIAIFVGEQRKIGREQTLETISCSDGELVFLPPL